MYIFLYGKMKTVIQGVNLNTASDSNKQMNCEKKKLRGNVNEGLKIHTSRHFPPA